MDILFIIVAWLQANGAELAKDVLALVTAVQVLVALLKTLLDQLKQAQQAVKAFRQ